MPDTPENPEEKKQPLDEQSEAKIVEAFNKVDSEPLETTNYKVRKDLFDALVAKGMPVALISRFLGKIRITMPDNLYGTEVCLRLVEISAGRLFKYWLMFKKDMTEDIFVDVVSNFAMLL